MREDFPNSTLRWGQRWLVVWEKGGGDQGDEVPAVSGNIPDDQVDGRQAGFEDSFAPKQTHHALSMVRSTKHAGSLDSLIAMFQHTNISAMSTSYRAQDLISGMTEWRAHASAALESCFCLWLTKSNDDRPGRPSGMAQNQLGSTPSAMLKGRRMRWLRVI
ncbi:hypothetical protein BGZ60DRAFT_428745 [Tricladium varicosporioides]|nr:hypothetical protein BGZ60DRAFT_428745 [Hymenoscyphus varicosporioides]